MELLEYHELQNGKFSLFSTSGGRTDGASNSIRPASASDIGKEKERELTRDLK
jgi:hypothetical protein